MKRNTELGASFIKTMIVLSILFFGGLILFQYGASFFMKNNIYTEIHDGIGYIVGDSPNAMEIRECNAEMVRVLEDYQAQGKIKISRKNLNASYVKMDGKTGGVLFYYEYTLILNLLVTQTTEDVRKHGTLQ